MSNLSSTAGKACVECNIPDPCVVDVITDFPENKEHHVWSEEGVVHFDLLDSGQGCKGTITIKSKCDKEGCPDASLEEYTDGTSDPLLSNGNPNDVKLYYEGIKGSLGILDLFCSPWDYLSSITLPTDFIDEKTHYAVVAEGCYERRRYAEIHVYPTTEIRFTVGLSYELQSVERERGIKERREEQIKSRLTMNDTLPKNKNKLRDGWTYKTAKFELIRNASLNVDFGVKVCNVDFSREYEKHIKQFKKNKVLEQLSRANELMEKMNSYFSPDPSEKNKTRKYNVFSCEIKPIKIGVSYAYQYVDIKEGPCHYYGLYAKPFLEANFKIDIIQFICAYYAKMDDLAARCRSYLDKHGASVECYLEVTPGVDLDIGAAYSKKDDEWSFNIKDTSLNLGIKGVVSAAFEMEVLVVELTTSMEATISTGAKFQTDKHDKGLDLVLCHDGIKGTFKFAADIDFGKKRGNKSSSSKFKDKIEKQWELCSPLKAEDSFLRINLYGKERIVSRPAVSPPIRYEPWAMGSNPNWNRDKDTSGYYGVHQ